MPRKEPAPTALSAQAQQDLVSDGIENYELPKSTVMKIAKGAITDSTKLQKETVLSLVKGSTVFINYLAATAHDVAQSRQHKSISASDVFKALEMMQFGNMIPKLQNELTVHRDIAKHPEPKSRKSNAANGSAAGSKKGATAVPGTGSSVSSAAATPASIGAPSASSKGKGKEKAAIGEVVFSSIPQPSAASSASAAGEPMEVDEWDRGQPGVAGSASVGAPVEEGDDEPRGQPIVLSDDEDK